MHLSRARRSWFFPSVEVEGKQDEVTDCNCVRSHVRLCVCVCVTLTIHKSLQALHQGFDRARQVPRILLDVLVDNITTTNCPVFCLAKLYSQKKPQPRNVWAYVHLLCNRSKTTSSQFLKLQTHTHAHKQICTGLAVVRVKVLGLLTSLGHDRSFE